MEAWGFAGQGSQRKGMGADLFERYADHVTTADRILGYSVAELCLEDPGNRLGLTQYAQPALFVVNALGHLRLREERAEPDYLVGHSLGEYNALHAAGSFDFETGLRLVRRRGELMGRAHGGSMSAVVGLPADTVSALLAEAGLGDVDVANLNSAEQTVLAGPRESLAAFREVLRRHGTGRCLPLNVSAAFHSRYMAQAAAEFGAFLHGMPLRAPRIPVVSNVTATPHPPGEAPAALLVRQIDHPVRWSESMRWLLDRGVTEFREIGPSPVLTGFWRSARAGYPTSGPAAAAEPHAGASSATAGADGPRRPDLPPADPAAAALGSAEFRRDYGVRYAYLAGAMFRGISSTALVCRLARAGLMGYFGAGGLGVGEVAAALTRIRDSLGPELPFGMNLLHDPDEPELEDRLVELYLAHGVRYVEAAAYTRVTPALVRYRFSGAAVRDGEPVAPRHVLAKVSRPEVARAFLAPPPAEMLAALVSSGRLTAREADAARRMPVSGDVCVEADSAGHTDGGVALTLVPSVCRLRDRLTQEHGYRKRVRVGAAGGLGSPEAVAAAFVLGADFVVTGSVNQCTPEADTSEAVKELLAGLDIHDTTYAPAGDLFEAGSRVQVVRKGTLFAARANKLHQLYRQHGSIDEIDEQTRRGLERSCFRRPLEKVWEETRAYYLGSGRGGVVERAERDPKFRMALVFKWYFAHSNRAARAGDPAERANFQIHSGPAIGAFNHAVRGTPLQDWRARHVDEVAEFLMRGAAGVHRARSGAATGTSTAVPAPAGTTGTGTARTGTTGTGTTGTGAARTGTTRIERRTTKGDTMSASHRPPTVATALAQVGRPLDEVLHSANAGGMVERVAQVAPGHASTARRVAREMAEQVNDKYSDLATVFCYEETFGVKDRIHWLLHFRSLEDYEALLAMGGGSDLRNGVFGGGVADQYGEQWNACFVAGSVQETLLLPHRWGMFGTATEAMAADPSMSPNRPGANPPFFEVQPAQAQTSLAPEDILNTANAGIVMRRTVDYDYSMRAEARVFARTIAETANLNSAGLASVLVFEEPFGPMDRMHFFIHLRSLGSFYTMMGIDARTDPSAPRAEYLQQWVSMEKGGGSWDRIMVQGSVRDSALTPQVWR